jgi:hypothetical protein
MSSGHLGSRDTCTAEEILRAADAFDHLGLSELAHLTRRLVDADFSNGREQRRNRAFYGLEIGLQPAFERRSETAPEDFDPPLRTSPSLLTPLGPGTTVSSGTDHRSGTVIVHELGNRCTLDVARARLSEGFVQHERATLHDSVECEVRPSGRDWAR